mgnify:FL=1
MAINVTKPAINLREKLNEVTLETGIKGEELLNSDTSTEARNVLELDTHLFTDFESTGIDDNATSTKLTVSDTGIDVTGSVTADGLTVDGELISMAHTGNTSTISLTQKVGTQNSVATISANREDTTTSASRLMFNTNDGTSTLQRMRITNNGDISFYEDTGTTPKFFWDASAERLGIGTSSPNAMLHLSAPNSAGVIRLENTFNTPDNVWEIVPAIAGVANTGFTIRDVTDNVNRLVINGSGNVGIGTNSPNAILSVHTDQGGTDIGANHGTGGTYPKASGISFGATSTSLTVDNNGGTVNFSGGAGIYANNTAASGNPTDLILWTNSSGTPSEKLRVTGNGSVGIGTDTPAEKLDVAGSIKASGTFKGSVAAPALFTYRHVGSLSPTPTVFTTRTALQSAGLVSGGIYVFTAVMDSYHTGITAYSLLGVTKPWIFSTDSSNHSSTYTIGDFVWQGHAYHPTVTIHYRFEPSTSGANQDFLVSSTGTSTTDFAAGVAGKKLDIYIKRIA